MCSHGISLPAKPDEFCTKKIHIILPGKLKICSARKFQKYLTFLLLSKHPANQFDVLQERFCKFLPLSLIFRLPGKIRVCSTKKFLKIFPGILSNLSFLAAAEQILCRTPPLAASDDLDPF